MSDLCTVPGQGILMRSWKLQWGPPTKSQRWNAKSGRTSGIPVYPYDHRKPCRCLTRFTVRCEFNYPYAGVLFPDVSNWNSLHSLTPKSQKSVQGRTTRSQRVTFKGKWSAEGNVACHCTWKCVKGKEIWSDQMLVVEFLSSLDVSICVWHQVLNLNIIAYLQQYFHGIVMCQRTRGSSFPTNSATTHKCEVFRCLTLKYKYCRSPPWTFLFYSVLLSISVSPPPMSSRHYLGALW